MRKLILSLMVAILAAALLQGCSLGDDEPKKSAGPVKAAVDGPDKDREYDDTVVAPRAAFDEAREGFEKENHLNLDDESPKAVSPQELEDVRAGDKLIREQAPGLPTAGASQGFSGCTTRFIRGYSSRRGVRPTVITDHYTVSANRPGWADVWGIVTYFDRLNGDANSHFVIDRDGNCAYIVPIEAKAHTQAAGNPRSVSVEVINTGGEKPFMQTRGYQKLVSVHRQVGKRARIPMRRGRVVGGNPVTSGIVQHKDGGQTWGGHHDVTPFSIDYIAKISAKGISAGCASKRTKQIADKLDFHRKRRNALPRSSARWRAENGHVASWERTARGRRDGLVIQGNRARRAGKLTAAVRTNLRCRTAVLNRRIS